MTKNFFSFHPFQGRPLFGPLKLHPFEPSETETFPSLSGKTSIRTYFGFINSKKGGISVSIPFREDLYSDKYHPFSPSQEEIQVSIPFREDLYSDTNSYLSVSFSTSSSFHPFQGRPSFGPRSIFVLFPGPMDQFPSLSGKTFIRT